VAVTIRPPDPADLAPLTGFLAGLSTRTRVQRFFAPVRPTPAMVRRACGQAGPAGRADVLLATHAGVIIGHAMAADRTAAGESLTEIGVVVADAWQGRGVGSALVRTLLRRAQARGVTSLSMDVLPDNHQVLAMIAGHWAAVRTQRDADCVTIQVGLPPARRERITRPLSVAEMPPPDATPAPAGEPVQTRTGRARLAGDARDGVMIRVDDGPLAVSSENSS
jgi:GNAT superfamily N-acetyltransferase